MKKILVSITVLLMTTLSYSQSFDYRVEGNVGSADGMKIIMTDIFRDDAVIDSAIVVDGKFVMQGKYDRNALVRVESGDRRNYAGGILDTLLVVDFTSHSPSNCSELNRRHNVLVGKMDSIQNELGTFYAELKSHGFEGKDLGDIYKMLYDRKYEEILTILKTTIAENGGGVAEKAISYSNRFIAMKPDEWDTIMAGADSQLMALPYVKERYDKFQTMRNTAPGKMFVDFEGKTVDGHDVKLSDYVGKGKYILVDFWASWCGPCRELAQDYLVPLSEKIKDSEKFEILGVATWDEPEASLRFLESHPSSWNQIIATGNSPMSLYGFNYIPYTILFAPDGTICLRDLNGDSLIMETQRLGLIDP